MQSSTKRVEELLAAGAELQDTPSSATAFSALINKVTALTIPRWHFSMLNDAERCDAFALALEKNVRPGMHVLDIGSGTGLLAMMAVRAGAAAVTTCEADPLLAEITRRIVAEQGMSETITVVPKPSFLLRPGVDLARPADLVVTEIVDCGLVGEGLLPAMRHARAELLAPEGRLVPGSARLRGALIESKPISDLNRVGRASGFDVSLFNVAATVGHFPVRTATWPHRMLGGVAVLAEFDFARDPLEDGARRVLLPVAADGTAHAVLVWWEMDLGGGVVLRNSPDNTGSHWMQGFVSFRDPMPVRAGETLSVVLRWEGTKLYAEHDPPPPEVSK
ncbi:50S ribosomal protein L11 methyltransferase [Actinomadura terrae]|uniref:50S ribosomal protein L11 methyltransferase n=1 Tax=Actinomadura terrae TaxID=604353 RepID=UPI001FA74BDE|nr:50S ribosomal protein L11 methyltransferase [Actinomadura terrae]